MADGRLSGVVSLRNMEQVPVRKQSGRAGYSFSGVEIAYLEDALKHLLTGQTRKLLHHDNTTGVNLLRKAIKMRELAAADSAKRTAEAEERQRGVQQQLSSASSQTIVSLVASDKAVIE